MIGDLPQARADVAENFVAAGVTIRIIDFLKVVDVQQRECKRLLSRFEFCKLLIHPLVENTTIGQSCQRIGARLGEEAFELVGLRFKLLLGGFEARLQLAVG